MKKINEAKYFEVRDSKIHGKGAFAVRKIRAMTTIAEYKGEIINNDEWCKRSSREGSLFFFSIGRGKCIDAGVNGNSTRFINHSCDPNCDVEQIGKQIFIYATKTINVGEEINYDYAVEFDRPITKKDLKQYACKCGSEKCRTTMIWLNRDQKKKFKIK